MARTKIPVAMRLDPNVVARGKKRAKEQRRSFAGHVEWLLEQDAERARYVAEREGIAAPDESEDEAV